MTMIWWGLLAAGVGAGLSVFYFGGLWMTVQRAVTAERPWALLLGSFVMRSAFVMLGFALVLLFMGDRWELLVAALAGFIGTRSVLVRRWRPPIVPDQRPEAASWR